MFDLRLADKNRRAVPAEQLASSMARFPADRKAPVVLYDAGQATAEAFATGHSRTRYLNAVIVIGANGSYDLTEK